MLLVSILFYSIFAQKAELNNSLARKTQFLTRSSQGNNTNCYCWCSAPSSNQSGNGNATYIVAGAGNFGGTILGTWLVNVSNRGSKASMEIISLMTHNSGTVQFGYYIANNTIYFGVAVGTYSGGIQVTELENSGMFTNGTHYNAASNPTGWTSVNTRYIDLQPNKIQSSNPGINNVWYNTGTRV